MLNSLSWANYIKVMTDFNMLHLCEVFWKRKISEILIVVSHCLILKEKIVSVQAVIYCIREG
jgi:hypothetical protein